LTAELELVRYAAECDLVLVAPATANTIAKMAAGVADNPVTTLALTAIRLVNVDLPAPLGPTRPYSFPAPSSIDTSSTARIPPVNVLLTLTSLTAICMTSKAFAQTWY
jgi:hypothetical protein